MKSEKYIYPRVMKESNLLVGPCLHMGASLKSKSRWKNIIPNNEILYPRLTDPTQILSCLISYPTQISSNFCTTKQNQQIKDPISCKKNTSRTGSHMHLFLLWVTPPKPFQHYHFTWLSVLSFKLLIKWMLKSDSSTLFSSVHFNRVKFDGNFCYKLLVLIKGGNHKTKHGNCKNKSYVVVFVWDMIKSRTLCVPF